MTLNNLWRGRPAQILLGAAVMSTMVIVVRGTSAKNGPVPLATDWSHRHLIFSQPHSLLDSFKLSSNPRYVQQWIRRNFEKKSDPEGGRGRGRHQEPNRIQGDWNVYLGNLGTVGAGNYPAKFSFDMTAASCTAPQPDFIVYNTSLAGSDTAIAASDNGAFSAAAAAGSTITITNNATLNTLVLTARGANANTGTGTGTFIRTGGINARANNLATAINIAGNGSFVGVTATAAAGVVTVTSTTPGTAGNGITVASDPTSDFTWNFATFVNGASGVATIAAFDNLYSSCTGAVPSPYWAYNTGTGATAATSVIFSKDGSQVAFVQNVGAGGVGAQLVLLKWAAGTSNVNEPQDLTGPTTDVSNASYRACTAPCMTTINFSGGATDLDTNSSPFYDFDPGDDTLYVGDDIGSLHKYTGVFTGTPGETISTGADVWPAVVNAGHILTSPVYDDSVGAIFVADNAGILHRVDQTIGSGAGGIVSTAVLSSGAITAGITASPTVDASIGNVYVFVTRDATTPAAAKRPAVCQFSTSFTAGFACSGANNNLAGVSSTNMFPPTLYPGDFDNIYFNSTDGTGNLYVCGVSSVPVPGVNAATVWQIPITAGVMGFPVPGPQVTTANVGCSPVTESMSGATDLIFMSVTGSSETGTTIGCPVATSGCIMSFDVTNPAAWPPALGTFATATVAGGSSGISIDSTTGTAGSSQIYFTPLAAGNCTTASGQGIGGCATQASQAALR
ncbi:MAG: hypothetical protein WCA41_18115 [Candidatus Acidiferrum sp.]